MVPKMAGMITVRPSEHWSTSGWMFRLVLRSIAADVTEAELVARLIEIDDEKPWLPVAS